MLAKHSRNFTFEKNYPSRYKKTTKIFCASDDLKNIYLRENIFPEYKLWRHSCFSNFWITRTYQPIIIHLEIGKLEVPSVCISTWCFTKGKFSNKFLLLEVIAFYSPKYIKDSVSSIVIQFSNLWNITI